MRRIRRWITRWLGKFGTALLDLSKRIDPDIQRFDGTWLNARITPPSPQLTTVVTVIMDGKIKKPLG